MQHTLRQCTRGYILYLFWLFNKDIFLGLSSGFFIDNSIVIHPMHEILINTEFGVPTIFKLLPFIFTILFSVLAIIYPEVIHCRHSDTL
jgi:NADH-ubiquinone oxidoreductase chain 5